MCYLAEILVSSITLQFIAPTLLLIIVWFEKGKTNMREVSAFVVAMRPRSSLMGLMSDLMMFESL